MYRVQLQNFEGPLDLLLYFIRRDELDIYDIPISYITEKFMEYMRFMEELDLAVASEFIYMASLLMSIKAKMMIPVDPDAEEPEEEHDPRYELVQALLEYKRFKEMSEEMALMSHEARKQAFRGSFDEDQVEPETDHGELLKDITLFDLMGAFKKIMLQVNKEPVKHKVERYPTNIEQQSDFVLQQIKQRGRLSFIQLCANMTRRLVVVVTFLAILEMVKERKLLLFIGNDPTDFYLDLLTEPTTVAPDIILN